jgi:hypothetical protein
MQVLNKRKVMPEKNRQRRTRRKKVRERKRKSGEILHKNSRRPNRTLLFKQRIYRYLRVREKEFMNFI